MGNGHAISRVLCTLVLTVVVILSALPVLADSVYCDQTACGPRPGAARLERDMLAQGAKGGIHLYLPRDESVLAPDMASVLFDWGGATPPHMYAEFSGGGRRVVAVVDTLPWEPPRHVWRAVRESFAGETFRARLLKTQDGAVTASGGVTLAFSADPFDARVMFMQIPLPFLRAQHNPRLTRWRMADVSSYDEPSTVLSDLPYCANCHAFSRDGSVFGLDMDYRKDKGGYVLKDVSASMDIDSNDVFSWSDYRPGKDATGVKTMGLFSKISPDGRKVMGTVKERSFFFAIDDVDYSQLFFPIRGHLAWYSRDDGLIRPLPGADSPEFVQTGPAWSPDGKTIAFSRAPVPMHLVELIGDKKFLEPGENLIEDLNELYPMHYDIWTVPFNGGRGGAPMPLAGASANGKSNFFPRYTPDGRWIVYVRSDTGLVMQPSSRLVIVPAQGGQARELECNLENMNSWHSFSPNGRWMVFSSKEDSPFTAVYAAHLDEEGHSAPPVLLHRLSSEDYSSIIPEAVASGTVLERMALVEP